jgi:pterin-4a-carbinolamine dehydratase
MMPSYSLKQFLLENKEPARGSMRMGSVSRLIGGMKKTKTLSEDIEQPITPKGTGWDHLADPNRLRRVFEIASQESRRLFINDVLTLADQTMHHIELHIIMNEVSVEIYTEELNDITEIDFEYAKDVDEMYVDAMFSYSNKNLGDTHELW